MPDRGLLGRAEPSLRHGGTAMGEHSEVYIAFDRAKLKHAVAIAQAGREGEFRFWVRLDATMSVRALR